MPLDPVTIVASNLGSFKPLADSFVAMGYYGLGPGLRTADKLSDFERALRGLPLSEALAILNVLETLTRSIVSKPKEEKHRQIAREDKKFGPITRCPEALDVLHEMGWVMDQEPFVLPGNVRLDFQKHVGGIIDAKDFYVKEHAKAKRAAKSGADPAKVEALRQIEIDRQERAALDGQMNNRPLQAPSSTEIEPAAEVSRVASGEDNDQPFAIGQAEQKKTEIEEVTAPNSESAPATCDTDLKALAKERRTSVKDKAQTESKRGTIQEVTVPKSSEEPAPATYDVDLKALAKERMERERGQPKPPPRRQENRESYCSKDCTIS